ncbi:MAG: HupE/UreJ family protein [Thermoanaerobaculia bacterium]
MPLFLAHLMTTGLGPFYDGLAHLFVTPEDLLPVLALSLAAGLRGPAGGRAALFVLPAGWFAGTMLGRLFAPHWIWPVFSALLTVAFGALAAIDRKLPTGVVAVLAATLGLWNGSWNGIELARSGTAAFGTGLGIACAVFIVVALAGALAAAVRALWARIAVRVAGSWIAAAGLFMMGWALR